MAYTYSPFEYKSTQGPAPRWDDYDQQWINPRGGPAMSAEAYAAQGRADQAGQFQAYSQDQFKNLFNSMGTNNAASIAANEARALQAKQAAALARQTFQASLPQMPTMQPMQQSTYTGGGWGQASPTWQMGNMTQRQQAPTGILGTTNRGMYGGILGGE